MSDDFDAAPAGGLTAGQVLLLIGVPLLLGGGIVVALVVAGLGPGEKPRAKVDAPAVGRSEPARRPARQTYSEPSDTRPVPDLPQQPSQPKPRPAPADKPTLTREQRVAWEKIRRISGQTPNDEYRYQIARLSSDGQWRMLGEDRSSLDSWTLLLPLMEVPNLLVRLNLADARKRAAQAAAAPASQAVAIVDLYGGDWPVIVEWYYDDGTRPQRYAAAPKAEWADSLNRHFLRIVTVLESGKP